MACSLPLVPRFGWIGLGSMGLGMAKNLQRHLGGISGAAPLVCTNRTVSRTESVVELGGISVDGVVEVVERSDVVFVSTSDDTVLKKIIAKICDSGHARGKLVVETTTVHPATSREVDEALRAAGAAYVASPVFGASPLAESGQLLFILGGPAKAIESITPYIKGVMGKGYVNVGEDPSKALLMKTTGNFITASLMEVISEAHVFAEKSGLGSAMLESLIEQNWGGILYATSSRITSGAYVPPEGERPRSDLGLAIKDVQHGITSAKDVDTRLQVAEVVMDHYQKAMKWSNEHNSRQLDSSSMYGVLRTEAGLDFESEAVKENNK